MGDREERVRTQYETWLAGHTPVALYVRWYLRHGGARYARPLFAAMGDERLPRVLDVGCATGFYLKWAFEHGHGSRLLAGVDLSPVMLAEAAARLRFARDAGADVQLNEASATRLPFPDESFDALICNGVVKYFDDEMLSSFLLEAARVLRSGGRVAIADFDRPVAPQSAIMPPERLGIPVDHLRPADLLCGALIDHGFEDASPVTLKRVWQVPLTYAGVVATKSSHAHAHGLVSQKCIAASRGDFACAAVTGLAEGARADEPIPPPPGWNKTLDDLFEEARRGERGPLCQPETGWAMDYERSLLPPGIRYPRKGDVYEVAQDTPVEYLTAWRAPRTGSGKGVLMVGDRVKIEHGPVELEPIGVYAVPVDYEVLESRMVPADTRSQSKYEGFYFFLTTDELNSRFKLLDST